MIQAKNVLDPFIYFQDGSNIDTNSNILTMANGTQIDTTTGAEGCRYLVDHAIGERGLSQHGHQYPHHGGRTQIDTVTGLTVSVTA